MGKPRAKKRNLYNLRADARGVWHCDFSTAGERVQRSTFTTDYAAAEEWCAQVAGDIWRQKKLGESPSPAWEVVVSEWYHVRMNEGRDLEHDRNRLMIMAPRLEGRQLHTMDRPFFERVLSELAVEREWSPNTYNRYQITISSVLTFARGRGYRVVQDAAPKLRKAPQRAYRWITKAEAQALLADMPLWLERMVRFSLATGLRKSNVSGLRWRNVDLKRRVMWVRPEDAKAGKFISVPLNDDAMAVLIAARNCQYHGNDVLVFTRNGNVVNDPNGYSFKKAVKHAGVQPFRWHDLRHTWATWHVMAGTSIAALQQLGGWASINMVMRYAHVAPDHIATVANNIRLDDAPRAVASNDEG